LTKNHSISAPPAFHDGRSNAATGFLQVESLAKHYTVQRLVGAKTIRAVDGVSLVVNAGDVMGLVGESGCGKSTFARLVTRLSQPTDGKVFIDGEDWLALKGEELRRRRRGVQLIFQDASAALDPRMKIGTSMESPLAQHDMGTTSERRERVIEMLHEVGLDESFCDRLPRHCSGGQLQRVVIGRALLLDPELLICDEPTSALDASTTTQILNLLMDLKLRRGLTMILISHDLRVVRFLCDRISVMYLGKIVEIADTERLFDRPVHPYTQSLMAAALLDQNNLERADALIHGDVPDPLNLPDGCSFHTRCPYSRNDCTKTVPSLTPAYRGHQVRCHHWKQFVRDALASDKF